MTRDIFQLEDTDLSKDHAEQQQQNKTIYFLFYFFVKVEDVYIELINFSKTDLMLHA
jgi:hypothetical protein